MPFSAHRLRGFLIAVPIALVAALACSALHTPLPWMIGPLFATALACMLGAPLACPLPAQNAGQWAIGTALGLYFTPAVLLAVVSQAGYIIAGAVFALVLSALCARLLQKLCKLDFATAFFAMAVGGASEMAVQGERHGASGQMVAAAHGLRILMVVAIIPFGFKFAQVHGSDPYLAATTVVHAPGLVALILLTCAGAVALSRLRWPNVWVIGPLLVTLALTGSGFSFSALPAWMIALGQLFIGVSLGTRFTPAFVRTAPRFLASVALCCLVAIALAAAFGFALGWASGIPVTTAILATAPGGIAEMSLTAKTLQLGVPVVTAFHVTRLFSLVLVIGPFYRLLNGSRAGARIAGS